MGVTPRTGYAKSGDLSIAYQVVGEGPLDVVFVPGFVSHIDLGWELPPFAKALHRFSSFARMIVFDKRGTGLSDRTAGLSTLSELMDDIRAVMDAAGSERAAVIGLSQGGPAAMLFAATFPERTASLVLWLTAATAPIDQRDDQAKVVFGLIEDYMGSHWGDGTTTRLLLYGAPGDAATDELIARFERNSATPAVAQGVYRRGASFDARSVLPAVTAPTLLVGHSGDPVMPMHEVKATAEKIAGARLVELPVGGHVCWDWDVSNDLDVIEEFLTGARQARPPERVLATVLYTDIVGSTAQAEALGDRRWRELLDAHDAVTRRHLARFDGREVKTTGDGFLAVFNRPAQAIECARAVIEEAPSLGMDVRAGVHTGECEVRGEDLAGITMHVGARVASTAGAGEVLVSRTVRDLVAGSHIEFDDRGEHTLKGLSGTFQLFAVRR